MMRTVLKSLAVTAIMATCSGAWAVTIPPPDDRSGVLLEPDKVTTVTVPATSPDYIALFDEFDEGLNGGLGMSMADNSKGQLAWLQSYHMMGYMSAWKATGDTKYLDKIADQFSRMLECRDDRLGRVDVRTSSTRKGWGTLAFDKTGWHVFVVHTGMICLAPAEFVREVKSSETLTRAYGTTASVFLRELEDMLADASADFKTNADGEGWFEDANTTGIVPLNMSNAMGRVILELHHITGKPEYRKQATELATYLRNCMKDNGAGGYNWAYWPRSSSEKITRGEDISHAAINVDFAVRCHKAGIVFTKEDLQKLGNTWNNKVRRANGTWSGFVNGERAEKPEVYIPQAPGRWLGLYPYLSPETARVFYSDVARAFSGQAIIRPSSAYGVAQLGLYKPAK